MQTEAHSPIPSEITPRRALEELLAKHAACVLASAGGATSPWVLGVYFAHEGNDLYLVLEQSGRTLANLRANPKVAILISANDATQDFAQAQAIAEVLPASDEDRVRQRIVAKLPWFATYTPVLPVRVRLTEAIVTSLQRGWFPGQKVSFETPRS